MSIYMQSTLEISGDGMERFIAAMSEARPILEGFGWKLVTAFTQFTGRLHTVVDVWEMEDAATYQRGLMELRNHPFFPEFKQTIAATVQKETVVLGLELPYARHS